MYDSDVGFYSGYFIDGREQFFGHILRNIITQRWSSGGAYNYMVVLHI